MNGKAPKIVYYGGKQDMKRNVKVGLALGSGAARGIAHIGVLQVMEENRIPIDMVAGTSIGALIGALYCCGMDTKIMGEIAIRLDEKNYFDLTVPRKGFMRGDRFQSLIRTVTKNQSFEDLKIPLAIVSCDLNKSQRFIFRSGKLHKAVRASISIPGIFEPVEMDGRLLVDGGVVDRVPVGVIKQMGADITIGVDVGFRGSPRVANGILDIILHSFEIMEWEMVKYKTIDADVMITPELQHISPITLAQAEECIELGREAALKALPSILEIMERKGQENSA